MPPSLVLPTAAAAQLIPEMPDALRPDNLDVPARHLGPRTTRRGTRQRLGEIGPAHIHTHERLSLYTALNKTKLLMSFPLPA